MSWTEHVLYDVCVLCEECFVRGMFCAKAVCARRNATQKRQNVKKNVKTKKQRQNVKKNIKRHKSQPSSVQSIESSNTKLGAPSLVCVNIFFYQISLK